MTRGYYGADFIDNSHTPIAQLDRRGHDLLMTSQLGKSLV